MIEPADKMSTMRDQYRELAVEWDEARDNPPEANRLFDALHALYKKLRDSAAGRQAIASLLDDPITAVRLAAATHSLAWQPAKAEQVLREIEQEGSLHAVTAKWTLRSYRSGKLNLDW
jgi:predicted aminopeptidase